MQLELFQPTAEVVAFPLARCIGRARQVAVAVLRRKTPGAQQAEFERTAKVMARRLHGAGVSGAEVSRQIDAFTRAVNNELYRCQMIDQRRPPGVA